MSAPAVRRLGARAVRRLGLLLLAGGRALNDELVVIINDDKFICVSVCC